MVNLFKKLFKGSGCSSCNVKIEEVKTESQDSAAPKSEKNGKNNSCCKAGTDSKRR